MPRRMFVNVYERDRHYGGPEEGGWWWDSFEKKSSRRCASEKQARQWQAKIEASFSEPHYGVYTGTGSRVDEGQGVETIQFELPECWTSACGADRCSTGNQYALQEQGYPDEH